MCELRTLGKFKHSNVEMNSRKDKAILLDRTGGLQISVPKMAAAHRFLFVLEGRKLPI